METVGTCSDDCWLPITRTRHCFTAYGYADIQCVGNKTAMRRERCDGIICSKNIWSLCMPVINSCLITERGKRALVLVSVPQEVKAGIVTKVGFTKK